jgi:hypothetical protein
MAASGAERDFCVLEVDKHKCAPHVQRKFRTKYGGNPPTRKAIYHWHKKFVARDCLCPEKSGPPGVSEEDAERVRDIHEEPEEISASSFPHRKFMR